MRFAPSRHRAKRPSPALGVALVAGALVAGVAAAEPTLAARQAAAREVAHDLRSACAAVRPFYWEIGDASGALDGGSVDAPGGGETVRADTRMGIASASKWLFAAYVVQQRAGALTPADVDLLRFRSGYTRFSTCLPTQTVGRCQRFGRNGEFDARTAGRFFYNGGHMQKHAVDLGLGPLRNAGLAAEMRSVLGADIALDYTLPQPAGGAATSAADYARFLRKLLTGELLLGAQLGQHAVCTNPLTCPREALATPIPLNETWHYSLGHWVEDDPAVGDGAFSSAGAFGFYPWVDAGRQFYGVLARSAADGGQSSMECGRLIRRAWLDGLAPAAR